MRRREFITKAAACCLPGSAFAQSKPIWCVAYLTTGSLSNGEVGRSLLNDLKDELNLLGYVEGKNLILDPRASEIPERLAALAQDLVDLKPDVIVASPTVAIAAVQRITSTIPIVMATAADPVGSGLVKSLSRPGGNITGIGNLYGAQTSKAFALLHELIPNAKRVAVLMSSNPAHANMYDVAMSAAGRMGVQTFPVRTTSFDSLIDLFRSIEADNYGAMFVLADPFRVELLSLIEKARLPAIYQIDAFVEAGGLASYGANVHPMFRQAAHYVDKILKGALPGDLPVEQPTKFEFVINLRTAKTLKIDVSPMLMALADRVIE